MAEALELQALNCADDPHCRWTGPRCPKGKPYKTLRRHLSANGLTPNEYRERYGLTSDYPMVAENYSTHRREMAHKIGLGRKAGQKVESAPEQPVAAPKQRRKLKTVHQTGDQPGSSGAANG